MELHSIALRDTLIDTLHELIDHTESVYLSLARQYPVLITEMQRSMDTSAAMVGSLAARSEDSSEVSEAVRTTTAVVAKASRDFQTMLTNDDSVFAAMAEGIGHLSSLEDLITRIRVDSEQMELISLNALTVALKAGSSGRAFSFITEELQRIAAKTIALTRDTTRKGQQVGELFREFRDDVTAARHQEQELFQSVQPQLEGCIHDFRQGVAHVHEVFTGMQASSTRIKQPLMTIMQEIQQQDIIKQSIDHVILTLQQMEGGHDADDREAMLDELSFLIALPDLARTVLQEVRDRITRSLEVFDLEARNAHQVMEEVEASRRERLNHLFARGEKTLMADWYSASETLLQDLFQQMRSAMHRKESLSHESRDLVQSVFQIEHNFNSFQTIISRFQNINMASRIEVAKSTVLSSMDTTIDEMNSLTERITDHVQEALDAVQQFISSTNSSITTYRRMIDEQKTRVESLFSEIRTSFSQLHRAQGEMSSQAADFSLFSHSFQNLFESTQHDLNGLRSLLHDLDSIFTTLDRVKQEAAGQRDGILQRMGLDSWDIESQKLVQLIDKFTIYTHKQAAGQLGGFSVDDTSADSGEVTLF
ncbi:hypothetical protein [Spirochaeta africana]|uniref:Methyl-accepting transducer domain-containing protein n=1 Tax=Spirochaeta africana (strain ATCC 700263 / DSM 8902 / Z-7692) TaxID=889378 RepID=H9UKM7_SPIAZ|nr:hypothetical protein [Spirochaeta africana]AFG38070.1 hypothetical protein Spiaf_2021 [Spirochaeta africana DSM 8902]